MCRKKYKKYWISRWKGHADWDLDDSFIEWINYWFKEYKKEASKMVNLEYHKFKYQDKEYTQMQIIDRIIELSDKIIEIDDYWDSRIAPMVDELFILFRKVFFAMWW